MHTRTSSAKPLALIVMWSSYIGLLTSVVQNLPRTRAFTPVTTRSWAATAIQYSNYRRFSFSALYAANDSDDDDSTATTYNLPGLRKEVTRLALRAHKKVGKANQRFQKATQEVDRLASDPDATLLELEKCPNVDALEADLKDIQLRLKRLNQLEVLLSDVKGKKASSQDLSQPILDLIDELEVSDEPPAKQGRGPKKEKGPRNMQSFRLPYRRFYTAGKVEIRVGKQAQDNDELSCNPQHRDGADWWMHASGCPGSHIVIRSHDANLPDDVVQDAAALAARQSKCSGQVITVSLTRARDVKKPPGAKAGLVQLTGSVKTIRVNMKKAQERLDRLDATMLVN